MSKKCIDVFVACVIVLLLSTTECLKNKGRTLSCWPYPVKYEENFRVDVYYSSRNMKNVLLGKRSVIGKDFDFDPNRRTSVIVHGFLSSGLDENVNDTRDALLSWQDMNVLAIDWQEGCENPLIYPQAAANTEKVADTFYDFISKLTNIVDKPIHSWKTIHFIGFSLGAHVMGQAAARLKKEMNLTIDRITGLDPAQPCFDNVNSILRLKKRNARFVDIIHTDGAVMKNKRFGLHDILGHADFYVNGGSIQPGCAGTFYFTDETQKNNAVVMMNNTNHLPPKNIQELIYGIGDLVLHVVDDGLCHHDRAFKLFIESIFQAIDNKCTFWAHPWRLGISELETSRILNETCNSSNCVEMGINAELYSHNMITTYYVKTNDMHPYCAN